MALTLGTLNAFLNLESKGFDKGVDQAEGRFKGLGSKLGTAGKAIGIGAGTAVAGGLAMGLAAQMEIGAATARLEAQLGGTGPLSQKAGSVAGKLYADAYGQNIGEATEAVRMVVQNISGMADASEADLQGITGQVMSLSDAFGQDLAGTTRTVDQMLRTGLAGSAQEALDILATGFQKGNDEAGDLLDTFNEYGTQFRKVGLDGQTAMGLITQGLQAGARDADVVADSIKEFSIRAIDGSKLTKEGFDALGLSAADMAAKIAAGGPEASAALDLTLDKLRAIEDPVKRDAAAVALFGTQAEDLGAALFALDPSTAVDGLGQVAGAAERTNEALMDTAANKITAVKREFELLAAQAVTLPGPLGTAAAAVVGMGPAALSTLAPIGTMIAAQRAAAAATAASGATMRASMVKTVAAKVAGWARIAVASTVGALKVAAAWIIAMGPVGWVIAAIVGLVALIIANWDRVRSFTSSAWSAVVGFVTGAASSIASAVTGGVSRAYQAVVSWLGRAVSFVASFPGRVLGVLGNLGGLLVGAGRSLIMGLWNGIKAAWDWVVGQVSGLMGTLRGLFPFSPAKWGPFSGSGYTSHSGRAMMRDFAKGISAEGPHVEAALGDVMHAGARLNPAAPRLAGQVRGGDGAQSAALYRAVRDALDGARMEVDGRGVARLVNRQNMLGRRRGSIAPAI